MILALVWLDWRYWQKGVWTGNKSTYLTTVKDIFLHVNMRTNPLSSFFFVNTTHHVHYQGHLVAFSKFPTESLLSILLKCPVAPLQTIAADPRVSEYLCPTTATTTFYWWVNKESLSGETRLPEEDACTTNDKEDPTSEDLVLRSWDKQPSIIVYLRASECTGIRTYSIKEEAHTFTKLTRLLMPHFASWGFLILHSMDRPVGT